VTQAAVRIEETVYDGHFDDPKSPRSIRLVPVGPRVAALLARRRVESNGEPGDLVFSSSKGTPLDRHSLKNRQLKPAAESLGLSGVTWHSLRHANATLHDSLGTPIGTVQSLLGHSSSEITRQVYLHALPEDRRLAAIRLEQALFGPTSDPNQSDQHQARVF
jgi:integrase